MNQYKKTAILWVLLLAICATLMVSCINPDAGDFYTATEEEESSVPDVTPTETPEETTPEETTPQETTQEATTPEETTPKVTTPEETTSTTPEETTTTTPEETTTVEKIKIYIDQGHNPFLPKQDPSEPNKGWNTGASNEELGLYEQDLTYEIGILLAQLLAQDDRFEVRLSRPTADTILGTDNDSALDFRINDAAEWGADYFISLHINSFSLSSANGLELCYTTHDTIGKELGTELIDALAEATGLCIRDPKLRDDLRVLRNAKMPATLVEMGFISNEDEAILLRDYPELFAQGLYNGVLSYFDNLEAQSVEELVTE